MLAVTLLAAACGAASSPQAPSGERLFASSCGGCHTLTGADSPSHQGGDLLHLHVTHPQLLQFAREMPVRHRLTAAQLEAVTAYVLAAEHRG